MTEVDAAATPARAAIPAAAPAPTPAAAPPSTSPTAAAPAPASTSKLARLIALLRQPDGATIEAMGQATGWQAHSVRGAMAGALKRKGLVVVSAKPEGGPRRYRIGDES